MASKSMGSWVLNLVVLGQCSGFSPRSHPFSLSTFGKHSSYLFSLPSCSPVVRKGKNNTVS